ncbi:SURF1 family protein [Alphaproteobacteria bacterium KMM 3653]|uniref:SURF1-like protein n=1 Tax=Harenicola maris TaxID=2841044 RepID=A0AAP2G2U2_9RHOB|nr:SURF1 family protein [Harenicola maris]
MRYLFPILLGLAGAGILVSLGLWQVQRLAWKEGILAQIEARITDAPVAVPAAPDAEADLYLPVEARGVMGIEDIYVLASLKDIGAVHRVISPLTLEDGRRVMIDRGWRPVGAPVPARREQVVEVTGNLHWPQEVDSFTPEPDPSGLMFARDLPAMAQVLGTEEILIVLRSSTDPDSTITPLPVSGAGIPNDHLQYAITWFGLAVVWLGMTGYWLGRLRKTA